MSDAAAPSGAVHMIDRGGSVDVMLGLPCGVADHDLSISGGADALRVTAHGQPQPLLEVLQLYSTVDPERTRHRIEDSRLVITLHKRDTSLAWPNLHAVREERQDQQAAAAPEGAGAALEERGRVRDLLKAAQDGDLTAFQDAAKHFGDSGVGRVRDGKGRTALHFAAQVAQLDMCRLLLEQQRMDVNVQDDHGETPLSLAAGAGQLETVELLLAAGADPRLCTSGSAAPLHRAASSGNAAVVNALIKAGADVEAASDAGTPLLWAAGSGAVEAVRALLAAGASPTAVAPGNISAVFMAAASGSHEVVELLLAAGADPNLPADGGATALHAAAATGSLSTVLALLQAGADVSAADDGGARAVEVAAEAGPEAREVVETLLPLTQPPPGWSGEWSTVALMDKYAPSASATEEGGPEATNQAITVPPPQCDDPAAAAEHKLKGDAAYRAGLFESAVHAYSSSLEAQTDDARVWANRSAAHLSAGNAAAALEDARIARRVDPTYAKAWYREGAAQEALQHWEPAAQAYFEAFRVSPDTPDFSQAFQRAVARGQQAHAAGGPAPQ